MLPKMFCSPCLHIRQTDYFMDPFWRFHMRKSYGTIRYNMELDSIGIRDISDIGTEDTTTNRKQFFSDGVNRRVCTVFGLCCFWWEV